MPRFLLLLGQTARWLLIASATVTGVGMVLVVGGIVWFLVEPCVATTVSRNTQLQDITFVVERQSCGLVGTVDFLRVSASRSGFWNSFKDGFVANYRGADDVQVERVDGKTLRLVLWASEMGSRVETWDGLAVQYDVRSAPR